MKKQYVILIACVLMISCSQQNMDLASLNDGSENDATGDIEKVEFAYKEGNVKIETDSTDVGEKIETSAPKQYLSAIRQLEMSASRQHRVSSKSVRSLTGPWVGVIEAVDGATGGFDLLEVYMDCEDHRNHNRRSGWIGNTQSTANTMLRFLLVPKSMFSNNKYARYAVLSLDAGPDHVIQRVFDNQDNSNSNGTWLNKKEIPSDQQYDRIGSGFDQTWRRTVLSFLVYDKDPVNGSENFPSIGVSYGVFGKNINPDPDSNGYIITDDEDDNNANSCKYNGMDVEEGSVEARNLSDILEIGKNTVLYMSKAKTQ